MVSGILQVYGAYDMKKIKYISLLFFQFVLLMFIGEMFIWNLEYFETEYISSSMFLPENTCSIEMIDDIVKETERNGCKVFFCKRSVISLNEENVDVYGMPGIQEILEIQSSVKEGEYQSIFLGKINIRIHDIYECDDMFSINNFYFDGDLDDVRNIKEELINKYGGNFPNVGYKSLQSRRNILILWLTEILFSSVLCFCEMVIIRKEYAIRFILGESIGSVIIKRMLQDSLFSILSFSIMFVVFRYILNVNVDYQIKTTIICLVLHELVNVLICMTGMKIDYKKSLVNGNYSKLSLNFCYITKVIILIFITIISSACIQITVSSIDYISQKKFFRSNDDKAFVSLSSKERQIDATNELVSEMLSEKTAEGKIYMNIYLDKGIMSQRPCLLFNKGLLDYLKKYIDISEVKNSNCLYYLYPKRKEDAYRKDMEFLTRMYIGEGIQYKEIVYQKNISLIGLRSEDGIISAYYNNPLIILNLSDNTSFFNPIYILQSSMIRISDYEWKGFIEENSDVYSEKSFITNCYNYYSFREIQQKRYFFLGVTTLILLFSIEFIMIKTIIYLEWIFNSTEITVRKILGYSIFEKYRKNFAVMWIAVGVSLLISLAISCMMEYDNLCKINIIFGNLIAVILDMICSIRTIVRMEKINTITILKGGSA